MVTDRWALSRVQGPVWLHRLYTHETGLGKSLSIAHKRIVITNASSKKKMLPLPQNTWSFWFINYTNISIQESYMYLVINALSLREIPPMIDFSFVKEVTKLWGSWIFKWPIYLHIHQIAIYWVPARCHTWSALGLQLGTGWKVSRLYEPSSLLARGGEDRQMHSHTCYHIISSTLGKHKMSRKHLTRRPNLV